MQEFPYSYEAAVRLAGAADARAVGGAVTVSLCGHWQHDGPCRWPHRTDWAPRDDGAVLVRVVFACRADEEGTVRSEIEAAIASGELVGPDGALTTWSVEAA